MAEKNEGREAQFLEGFDKTAGALLQYVIDNIDLDVNKTAYTVIALRFADLQDTIVAATGALGVKEYRGTDRPLVSRTNEEVDKEFNDGRKG